MAQIAVRRGLRHGTAPDKGLCLKVTVHIRAGSENRFCRLIEEDWLVVAGRTSNRRVVIELARHLDRAVIVFDITTVVYVADYAIGRRCVAAVVPLKLSGLPVTGR